MTDTTTEEEVDPQVKALEEEVQQKLEKWTEQYKAQVTELTAKAQQARGDGAAEIAEPTSTFLGIPFQWFDLLAVGPFQPVAPGGPFLPHRIIRIGEPAVLIAALWRNPLPLPFGPNPSAAQIMSPYQFTVRGETVNLSTVSNGPDFAPVTGVFGGGFVNIISMPLPPSRPLPRDNPPCSRST